MVKDSQPLLGFDQVGQVEKPEIWNYDIFALEVE